MHRYKIQKLLWNTLCCALGVDRGIFFIKTKLIQLYFVATRLKLEAIQSYEKKSSLSLLSMEYYT